MDDNMKRKQELESALKEYLSQAEMHPMSDAWKLPFSGDYALVFGLTQFYAEDDPDEAYCYLAPEADERKPMRKVDSLFESLVSPATVRNSLQSPLLFTDQNTEFIFPFETDEQEQQYLDKIYEMLNYHSKKQYDALVPMYQLECAEGIEFPLANGVLCSGGERSRLASIANGKRSHVKDSDRKQINLCSFLKIPVTGDNASRLEQVEYEADRALQVLRFIYPWLEKDGKTYNPAHAVSMWKHSDRVICYDRSSSTSDNASWHGEMPNGISAGRQISAELLNDANKYYYLDSMNYHFQNQDLNQVSRRFCRAFNFYDIATRISDADVALTNFAICVDILLPPGKGWELTDCLISLIDKGGIYGGKMTLNEQLPDPAETKWQERVKLTVSDYKAFYIVRNMVVHGNTMKDSASDMQVKKARQIAHNAIRAYAKLSRVFNWQSDKEAKQWFKQPCKPAEMKTP